MSISINNNKLLKRRQCRPSFKLNAYQTSLLHSKPYPNS